MAGVALAGLLGFTAACGPDAAGPGGAARAVNATGGPNRPSPVAATSPVAPTSTAPAPPITLAFAGDIHFEGAPGQRLAADPSTAVGPMSGVLSGADLAMANLETAITTRGTPQAKAYTFRAPPTAFAALRSAGIDVVTMANNHGLDFGRQGLTDTLSAIRATRFPVVGIGADEAAAYAPRVFTVRGQRIAVLGATQVLDDQLVASWTAGPKQAGLASAKRVDRLVEAVRAARQRADTVVIYLHWGMERNQCPIADQRALVPRLQAAGADIIVGSHAHVELGAGWTAGGRAFVDYGLGNFVFYASGSGPVTSTGVLLLTVRGRRTVGARWVPARIVDGAPQPLSGADATAADSTWNGQRGCTGLAGTPA